MRQSRYRPIPPDKDLFTIIVISLHQ